MLHTDTSPSYNYRTGSHSEVTCVLSGEKVKEVRRADLMGRKWELELA